MEYKDIFIIIFTLIIIIFVICLNSNKSEHFDKTMCQQLNKEKGITCSIPSSSLFPSKCYKIGKNNKNLNGWYEKNGNISNCRYYPDCVEIANLCNTSNIFKLEDGYVESI